MITIYGLYDPRTDELRYIGQAASAARRHRQHLANLFQSNLQLYKWKLKLDALGLEPRFVVIEEHDNSEDANAAERESIRKARADGIPLLNMAGGGLGVRPKKIDKLTRDDWIEIALRYRHARQSLTEISSLLSEYCSKSSPEVRKMKSVRKDLDQWRQIASAQVQSIYGEWEFGDGLFYGNFQPELLEKPD